MVVLTERVFRFSLFISQLLAKAIPVRGAKFEKPAFEAGFLLFCVSDVNSESHPAWQAPHLQRRQVCVPAACRSGQPYQWFWAGRSE